MDQRTLVDFRKGIQLYLLALEAAESPLSVFLGSPVGGKTRVRP